MGWIHGDEDGNAFVGGPRGLTEEEYAEVARRAAHAATPEGQAEAAARERWSQAVGRYQTALRLWGQGQKNGSVQALVSLDEELRAVGAGGILASLRESAGQWSDDPGRYAAREILNLLVVEAKK